MAEWPTVAAVKQSLGVTSADRDVPITAALAAAIEQVGVDIGYQSIAVDISDPEDVTLMGALEGEDSPELVIPSHSLSHAALILAVMAVKAPDQPYGIAAVFDTGGIRIAAQHPTYLRMLTGQRYAFGVG